jgi:hypothetical protein
MIKNQLKKIFLAGFYFLKEIFQEKFFGEGYGNKMIFV